MTDAKQWDWVDLGDEEGRVDHAAAIPAWSAAPEVELDGEWLLFHYPVRRQKRGKRTLQFRKVEAAKHLLTEFVQLDDAPAERILAYARRHGRFGFCQHGDPSHRLGLVGCGPTVRTTEGKSAVCEDLQWWRNLAGHARALLNVAAQISRRQVDDVTLARLNPQLCFSARLLRAARRDPAPFVAYGLELWLRFFQVRPRVFYRARRKRFEIQVGGAPPLAGALTLQMMLAVTRSTGVAVCSSCGRLFAPSRRINPNRNAYCKACGVRAAWREAQARRRAKKFAHSIAR